MTLVPTDLYAEYAIITMILVPSGLYVEYNIITITQSSPTSDINTGKMDWKLVGILEWMNFDK